MFFKLTVKSFTCQGTESGLCLSPAEVTETLVAGSCIPSLFEGVGERGGKPATMDVSVKGN